MAGDLLSRSRFCAHYEDNFGRFVFSLELKQNVCPLLLTNMAAAITRPLTDHP
jgi:hypothetical protein